MTKEAITARKLADRICERLEDPKLRVCMRLAAECRVLANDVAEPDLRARFLHMARMWTELADQPRVPDPILSRLTQNARSVQMADDKFRSNRRAAIQNWPKRSP
jgi:hypothetical protein